MISLLKIIPYILIDQCIDGDQGEYDYYDNNCNYYKLFHEQCGFYDSDNFTASEFCCACKRSTEQQGNELKVYVCKLRNI